jgi:hypothetical protein
MARAYALRLLLVLCVVLLAVYPAALAILLAIHLAPLLRRERPAVSLTVGLDFVMNRSFLLLQVRGFTPREGTIFDAFTNSLLLIPLTLVNLVLRQYVAHATQKQSAHHHAHHNAFHVQFPFLLRLSAASALLNEAHPHKV